MAGEKITGQKETLLKMETEGASVRFFVVILQVMAVPPFVFLAYYTGRGGKLQYIFTPRKQQNFRSGFVEIAQGHSPRLWLVSASFNRRRRMGQTPAAMTIFTASPGR